MEEMKFSIHFFGGSKLTTLFSKQIIILSENVISQKEYFKESCELTLDM